MKGRLRVLNAESLGYCDSARAMIGAFADLEECEPDRAALLRRIGAADALIVRLAHRVDEELLQAGPSLRVVVSATTGLDHIDLDAAARLGVDVLSLKGERGFLSQVTATAEHTWALLLALVRNLPAATTDVREGHWRRDLFRGRELSGMTLGVIGYGRLGRMVARYATAFDMRVLVNDVGPLIDLPTGTESCRLERLLAQADVVSLHVPLEPATVGLIGRNEILTMRRGTILINTSRGGIVDETALLDALASGHIAAAGLDVVEEERPGEGAMREHRLVAYARVHDNLLITPHIGGGTWDSMRKTEEFMAGKLRDWARQRGFAG